MRKAAECAIKCQGYARDFCCGEFCEILMRQETVTEQELTLMDEAPRRRKREKMRVERIGNATLYLGDAHAIVPDIASGQFDAIITDPSYGQAYKVNTFYAGGSRDSAVVQRNGKTLACRPNVYEPVHGDDLPFDPAPWLGIAPTLLFWGAHKFADRLPAGSWLVWDKVPTGKVRDQGDGEAAWINRSQPLRIFRLLWDGLCVGKGARHEVTAGQQRYHPMQKPETLMRWCIEQAGRPKSILDPYMGSGSTGVAAAQMGIPFTGIEIDEHYFDIACERIENAQRQSSMFTEPRQEVRPKSQLSIELK